MKKYTFENNIFEYNIDLLHRIHIIFGGKLPSQKVSVVPELEFEAVRVLTQRRGLGVEYGEGGESRGKEHATGGSCEGVRGGGHREREGHPKFPAHGWGMAGGHCLDPAAGIERVVRGGRGVKG